MIILTTGTIARLRTLRMPPTASPSEQTSHSLLLQATVLPCMLQMAPDFLPSGTRRCDAICPLVICKLIYMATSPVLQCKCGSHPTVVASTRASLIVDVCRFSPNTGRTLSSPASPPRLYDRTVFAANIPDVRVRLERGRKWSRLTHPRFFPPVRAAEAAQ